ncbi:uncharacterized protein LOC135166115 [Diachasmimorpha longicaudata]|uniref:uncharacterized protein LOC135166115 n=1 Tax=Diachasmimorpha longicaudata TaxID=58733 RepID=UPI0030B88E6C
MSEGHQRLNLLTSTFLILLMIHEGLGDCLTPWGQLGDCVPIKDCPIMRKMLDMDPLPSMNEMMFRQAFCGVDGLTYKVCCIPGQNYHQSETTINSKTESPGTQVSGEPEERCISLLGEEGNCVNIKKCPKMLDVLKKGQFADISHCGFEGMHPKVCCAIGDAETSDKIHFPEVVQVHGRGKASTGNNCLSSSGRQGNCINIRKCQKMLQLLRKMPRTEETRDYLRRSRCGTEGKDPKVCCEIDDQEIQKNIPFPEVIESHEMGKNDTEGRCLSLSGREGSCVNIRKCQKMVELLQKMPQTEETRDYLRRSRCGTEGRDPKVCCEIEDQEIQKNIHFLEVTESQEMGKNDTEGSCLSLSGREGSCVNIRKCQKMMELLQKTPQTEETRDYLRRSRCGNEGKDPKVCCELEGKKETKEEEEEEEKEEEVNKEDEDKEVKKKEEKKQEEHKQSPVEAPSPPTPPCLTPWGGLGRCLKIDDCEDLKKLYKQNPVLPMHEKLLEIARCGPGGLWNPDFRVCCGINQNVDITSVKFESLVESVIQRIPSKNRARRLLPHELCGPIPEAKIFGGNDTKIHEFPWMALLQYNVRRKGVYFKCGGSLISDKYVLTAAHCLTALPVGIKLITVRLGEYDTSTDEDCDSEGHCIPKYQEFSVKETKAHEHYSPVTYQNDVGLVKLVTAVDIRSGYIRPICLPLYPQNSSAIYRTPSTAVVTGWGATRNGTSSSRLKKVTLTIVANDLCQKLYRYNKNVAIWQAQLCAGGDWNKDSCSGDSGGPLQAIGMYGKRPSYVQYGVVSYGHSTCGAEGSPGIYTRVSHYVQWILDNMVG